jgi:hypothetical protein
LKDFRKIFQQKWLRRGKKDLKDFLKSFSKNGLRRGKKTNMLNIILFFI